MFDLDKIVYSTKPITLRERILAQQGANGDWQAMHAYICCRTNLTPDEAYELDDEDTSAVIDGIGKGLVQGLQLQNMLRSTHD